MAFHLRPFGHSSFVFALLFICCCCLCQSNATSLEEFACVKKDVPLFNGTFTSVENAQLKIDPSNLASGSVDAKIVVLLMNAKDDQITVNFVLSKGDKKCFENIRFPTAFDCLPGEPKEHEGCNNCSIDVTCKIPPFPVENLPDARLFRMEMWEISDANDNKNDHCVWVAYVDKAYILMKKSETDSDILDGRCWAKSRKIWLIVLMLVFCSLFIAGAVVFIVFMLVIRRRKRSKRTKPIQDVVKPAEPNPPLDDAFAPVEASSPSSIAVEQGVVVPDSLRSEASVVDDANK